MQDSGSRRLLSMIVVKIAVGSFCVFKLVCFPSIKKNVKLSTLILIKTKFWRGGGLSQEWTVFLLVFFCFVLFICLSVHHF